jgi:hypothetical protein
MVDVAQLEAKCTQQGGVVRELKKAKAPKAEITAAVRAHLAVLRCRYPER